MPGADDCDIAPPADHHSAVAEKMSGELEATVAKIPVGAGFTRSQEGVLDKTFQEVKDSNVACHMMLKTYFCLANADKREAAKDLEEHVGATCPVVSAQQPAKKRDSGPPKDAQPGVSPAPNKPSVVLMDSYVMSSVYCDDTRKAAGSNTDDMRRLLSDLGWAVKVETTNLEWHGHERVRAEKPQLIVLHASAFQPETTSLDADKKLLGFLQYLAAGNFRMLIYTRGLPDDAPPATKKRWSQLMSKLAEPSVARNAVLYVLPRGRCPFSASDPHATQLKNCMRRMVTLKADASVAEDPGVQKACAPAE